MGFFDKLFGREEEPQNNGFGGRATNTQNAGRGFAPQNYVPNPQTPRMQPSDEQALARYRYMLQTAPPEALEQAHEEAFSQLTPEQRQLVLQQLSQNTPENERAALNDDPRNMARAATRAEMRQPGLMERTFGGAGGGMGMGGMLAGSLLTSIAGGFVGSAIANSFFNQPAVAQDYAQSEGAQQTGDTDTSQYADADSGAGDGLTSSDDQYGDPGAATDAYGDPGADPYGDAGASDSGFDGGGFDGGGFDGGDFGGDF